MAVSVECADLVKRHGAVTVLDHVNWRIEAGTFVGLVGNSGAGKTSLLRVIAGLDACSAGTISFARAKGDKPRKVSIGMVFQNLALWPHLTARQHLECVLSHVPRRARRQRCEQLLTETRVPAAAWNRRPSELSGGEGQRLALARALAAEPDLLLLDEPLVHVDTSLRGELLGLLRTVTETRNVTALYVTHSWSEAQSLCQRIAVMDQGRIVRESAAAEFVAPPEGLC